MAKDHFPPINRLPLFLSDHVDEPEQWGTGNVVSSRTFKTIVLGFAAAAIVFAIVLVGNPIALFMSITASQVSSSAHQDGSGQSMPTIQSTASAQTLPPTAGEAPAGDEMLAAFKAAFENKTEVDQPTAEAMFNQFQAWAAKEDAQARVQPPQPVQDPRTQVVQKARAQPLPKPRPAQATQTARAQDPSSENAQRPVRIFGWGN
jgi:hypothetical protein